MISRRTGPCRSLLSHAFLFSGGKMKSELLHHLEPTQLTECTASRFPADKAGAWLSAIIQSTLDGVVIVDATLTLVLINREAERLFGYSARQLLGEPLDVLLPVRLQEEHRLRMDNLAARRIGRRMVRTRLNLDGARADGNEFPMDVSISRITVQGQMFMVMIVRDATEQHAAEQKYTVASTALRRWAVSSQQVTEVEKRR